MQVLVFDVGKTHCRARLVTEDGRESDVVVAGSRALGDPGGVRAVCSAMVAAADDLDLAGVETVAGAVAGFASAGDRATALADRLRRHHRLPLVLTDDVTAWHVGALAGRPGVVVAAGTGAVALAVTAAGEVSQSDGWGYLLGDEGGGFWIGRAGLMAALRAHDGRQGSQLLRRRAIDRFGALEDLPARVHADPVREIASFSRDVADASRDGDEEATRIWRRAGRALAETAAGAARRAGLTAPDVALVGGLPAVGDLLVAPFTDRLAEACAGARVVPAAGDPLDGLHHLVTAGADLHASRVRTFPAP